VDWLVSGDNHLLSLSDYEDIEILDSKNFLETIDEIEKQE